ncbi:MAG: glycosyltransferase, partial [Bradymonadaceae bacterium]
MCADSQTPLGVLQSCHTWLPTTQHWLATQVFSLPDSIRTAIACRDAQNLDQFHHARLHVRDEREFGPRPISWALDQLQSLEPAGYVLREWGRRRWADFRAELADREGAEVIHSHFGNTGWLDRPVARRADLAHVVSCYGFDISYLPRDKPHWRDRLQTLFQDVDRVLCEGPHFADQIAEFGCPRDKIEVHHL